MLFYLAIGLSLSASIIAAPTRLGLTTSVVARVTDTLIFTDTIVQFEAARDAETPSCFDWSSDGCSDSPDDPLGFDFLPSCHRHDFGYRNYKAQGRFTDDNKDKIDSNFKNDLYNYCSTKSTLEEIACKAIADVYYEAVSIFGSKNRRAVEEASARN